MKKVLSLLLVAAALLGLVACGAKAPAETEAPAATTAAVETTAPAIQETTEVSAEKDDDHYPVSIRCYDYARNHVEMVFEKAPERVLTYSLNSVENMIALGLEDKIIMAMSVKPDRILPKYREAFDRIQATSEEFLSKEDVLALQPDFILAWYSSFEDKRLGEILPKYREAFDRIQATSEEFLSKEDVLALQPDFILAWYSSFEDKRLGDVHFWNDRGIKTYMAYNSACARDEDYEYVTNDYIEREYLDILNLGKIFNVEDRAEALVAQMRETVAKGQEYASKSEPKNVVIIEDEGDGFRVYGEDTIGGQIATAVGANLLAKTRKERKSAEDLVVLNPDYDEGDGFRVYGEDTIGGQIATAVGANLLAKTRKERKSAEDLVVLNPDYVFGVHFGPNSTSLNDKNCLDCFKNNPALQNINAYKNGNLIPTDLTMVYSPGVRGPNSTSLNDKNCLDCFKNNPALQNINAYKNGNLIPTDLTMVYSPGVRILESFQFFIDNLYPEMVEQEAA